jgi:hypothetical protein
VERCRRRSRISPPHIRGRCVCSKKYETLLSGPVAKVTDRYGNHSGGKLQRPFQILTGQTREIQYNKAVYVM